MFLKAKVQSIYHVTEEKSWSDVFAADDPNNAYYCFIGKIQGVINTTVKTKTIDSNDNNIIVWLTKGIKVSCRTKRVLYTQRNLGLISDEYYRVYKNLLKKIIISAKKSVNLNNIDKSSNKVEATWKINQSRNRQKKRRKILVW
ncbi:hypothetical protein HHI36_016794 [Cryptolaemus montrouzieri]|uniref:Uncharacterized protein n=1 Tax=Cryptolaemus montrouzieri TaxID=559131 RepID=A0ABD2NKK7_9CUCU